MEGHKPVAAIVGVGPGLGLALAKRFAKEGFYVALLARNQEKVNELAKEVASNTVAAAGVHIDCTDKDSVKKAFESVRSLGPIEVLVYNTNIPFPWPPPKFTEIDPDKFEHALKAQCTGAFLCVQEVLPDMVRRSKGTILFTGATASVRGGKGFAELACGKFALRGMAQCLAREYHPQSIHVAHILIDGIIDTPKTREMMPNKDEQTKLRSEAIAETYWQVHVQDKSAWTHELDLRPFVETF